MSAKLSALKVLELYQKFMFITSKLVNIGLVRYLERAFGIKIWKPANKREELRNYVNFCIRHIVFRSRHKRLGCTFINIILSLCFKIDDFIQSDLKKKIDLAVEMERLVDNILGEIKDGRLVFQLLWMNECSCYLEVFLYHYFWSVSLVYIVKINM